MSASFTRDCKWLCKWFDYETIKLYFSNYVPLYKLRSLVKALRCTSAYSADNDINHVRDSLPIHSSVVWNEVIKRRHSALFRVGVFLPAEETTIQLPCLDVWGLCNKSSTFKTLCLFPFGSSNVCVHRAPWRQEERQFRILWWIKHSWDITCYSRWTWVFSYKFRSRECTFDTDLLWGLSKSDDTDLYLMHLFRLAFICVFLGAFVSNPMQSLPVAWQPPGDDYVFNWWLSFPLSFLDFPRSLVPRLFRQTFTYN